MLVPASRLSGLLGMCARECSFQSFGQMCQKTDRSVAKTQTSPYYTNGCAAVACPEHSTGTDVPSGCACKAGAPEGRLFDPPWQVYDTQHSPFDKVGNGMCELA